MFVSLSSHQNPWHTVIICYVMQRFLQLIEWVIQSQQRSYRTEQAGLIIRLIFHSCCQRWLSLQLTHCFLSSLISVCVYMSILLFSLMRFLSVSQIHSSEHKNLWPHSYIILFYKHKLCIINALLCSEQSSSYWHYSVSLINMKKMGQKNFFISL